MNSAGTVRWSALARIFMRASLRRLAATTCALAATFLLLAGVAAAQSTPPQFLFATTTTQTAPGVFSPSVTTYQVNPTTGALTAIAAPPALVNSASSFLAVNPAQTFLFGGTINSATNGAIVVLSIAADGSTTELPASPFGVVSNPSSEPLYLAVSRDGKYLFVVSDVPAGRGGPATVVDSFSIGADGTPTLLDTHTLAPGDPAGLFVHPTGKWLYVFTYYSPGSPDTGDPALIQQYDLNADGTLTTDAVTTLEDFSNPGLTLGGSPNGVFVFAGYQMLDGGPNASNSFLDAFQVNSITGNLREVSSQELQANEQMGSANAAAVDSTSTYVYNSGGGFTFANGVLAPVTASSNLLLNASGIVASPNTPFLFFGAPPATPGSPTFWSALINADGSLTPASTQVTGGNETALTGTIPVPNQSYLFVNPTTGFGQVVVGQVATTQITVSNWGFAPLTVNASISGDPSLTLSNPCTTPIAPASSCSLVVSFAPTSASTFSATVTINSNAPNAPTQTVAISALSVNPSPNPILLPSQQILMPDASQSSPSTVALTLENTSNATQPLQVSGITLTGTSPNDFSETNNCTAPVAAGSSCTINVTFTPLALGNRAALLNIASNGPGGIIQASINGNGVATVTKWTFNTSVMGPGTITQSPAGASFPNNTTIYLTAVPNANSSFVTWGGDCPVNAGLVPCTVVLTQNTNVTAQFEANVTLTTTVVGPGTITQTPPGTSFRPGYSVILTAVPNTGAQFAGWTPSSACGADNGPPTQCFVLLNANTSVTATFTGGAQVSLATNVSGPGTIQQSPEGTSFASGTSITLTAVPGAGAVFNSWSGACAGSANPVCTFAIAANTTVTATFAQQYSLTTSVSGPGTIQQSPSGANFNSGTSITLTAVPAAGSVFTAWTGPCAGSTNPVCTFAISANTTASATFVQQYSLTTSVSGPGTIQQSPAGTSFNSGTSITLTAVPNSGATFTSWSGACAGSTNPVCTVAIAANTAATATFTANPAVTVPQPMQMGAAGAAFTFPINEAGFATPPALTASCAIPDGTCTISGTTLTVTTTARSANAIRAGLAASFPAGPGSMFTSTRWSALFALLTMILGAGMLFVGTARVRRVIAPAVLLAGLVLLAACSSGGGGSSPMTGTPAGTYQVTIKATAGAQTATTVVSVVVQ